MKKSDINILIIEDDKSMRESLSEAVKRRGYKVAAVARPEEAESIVKIKPIHGIIADVMLPGRNGVDLVKKLKENLTEGVGIIFISGIYRDRSFALDSVKSVEAIEYFLKPFNIEEALSLLDKKLNAYIETPKVDLYSLLASPFASNRERRKALDHVEQMRGYDLPFALCILMDSESSGHLNIVDANQNIFGITMAKGALARVDSEATALLTKKLLVHHGFISELELSELKSKKVGGDLVRSLVDEGLMSPHVPGLIKTETIVSELKKLIGNGVVQINFVPDRQLKPEPDDIDLQGFTPYLHEMIDLAIPFDWLKSFYSEWLGYPIKAGPEFNKHTQIDFLPIMKRVSGILGLCEKKLTIEDLIAHFSKEKEEYVYKALHLMMLKRFVVFEELRVIKNIEEHISRLKSIHAELNKKSPIETFKYFGLDANPKHQDVVRIYKDFAKAHHPDLLPKEVSADIRSMNHELFSSVTAAYEILSNEKKRASYYAELKQSEAESQFKSDELVTNAALALSRGQYVDGLKMLQSAVNYYKSERSLLHFWWAKFKVEGEMRAHEIPEIDKQLKLMSQGMRKTALWVFVNGLIKRFQGDLRGAAADFTKTLTLEDDFMDARRELARLKALAPKTVSAEDFLTGDISVVMKGLFSKKKKGA